MDFLLPFFQLAYFVVHFIYSLGQAVTDCFSELYHCVSRLFRWRKHYEPSSLQLLQDASKLKKLPRHLGVILMSKQTNNLPRICYLINWCLGFGIHSLSLYDYDGLSKLKLPSLLDDISQICCNVTVKAIVDGQTYTSECNNTPSSHLNKANKAKSNLTYLTSCSKSQRSSSSCITSRNKRQNRNVNKYSFTLNILSCEDGKEDIVKIAKYGCDKRDLAIDTEYITNHLITRGQIDPDLVIVIGRPLCILGFLPWQIRLTEFLHVSSISKLDYYEFRKLLSIYSKCEQRFGS